MFESLCQTGMMMSRWVENKVLMMLPTETEEYFRKMKVTVFLVKMVLLMILLTEVLLQLRCTSNLKQLKAYTQGRRC